MKALPVLYLVIFFLLNVKGFDSYSQQAVFTEVPPPGAGWASPIIHGTQDTKGYMWFGALGVHRYDGYSYKSYYNDPLNPSSLVYNRIEAIYADRKGFIWVGTNRKGLDKLDPETGIFTHYRHNPSDANSISSDTISAILEDRDGKIWVGTEVAGLNCLDPTTGMITRFRHNPNDSNSLSYDKVTALYEDRRGTIWVGTGFLWHGGNLTLKQGGLNRFNRAQKNFTRYLHDPNNPSSLIDNRVRTIFEDSRDRFWVGTSGDGLHTMNRETGSFERHRYSAANPNGLSRPPVRNTMSWVDDMISFIREDATGAIWIGTLTGGLNRYDPETGKISYYSSLKEKSSDKNEVSRLWGCFISKDGVIWITAWGGVYHLDPLQKQIPYYYVGRPVNSLLQDSTGKLWLGTENGLIVYDSARINKKAFAYDISDSLSLSDNFVNSIVEDRSGTIWIGTRKGLNRYNHQSQKFTHYLHENHISDIYEDRHGSFWLGTDEGLVLMNRKDGSFSSYRQSTTSPSHFRILSITDDKAGDLWIGTEEGGLNRFDKRSNKFQNYLPGTSYHRIFEDEDSKLWIGTMRGLYYFNPSTDSFEIFTNPAAGLTENINVFQIREDDQQSLWINTSLGLFRLRHNRKEVRLFGKSHGIIPPLWATQSSSLKGKGGELFFGDYTTGNGYYAFFPEQLIENTIAPELHITGFRLGDQLVYPGTASPLSLPISQTKEIRLNYSQNVFSFDFAGIHYSSPEDNRHLFMLENLDNDWRKAGEEKTAYYYNVAPGKYVFRVKAASSDGVWAEKSIAVFISPPWWKTWWAYFMYGLLLIAGVVATHRIQKKRVITAEREKTKDKELVHAKEIEKAYTELKSTQAQLIQSEKMASLGELTAGIAHEIQNPLNFVNNFSEVNIELGDELKSGLNKSTLPSDEKNNLVTLVDDIVQNQEKINHHGKRADAIVKGMLQHSRISNGVKEPTNINALVGEYLRLAYHGLRAKDKSFNATMKTDFDETVGNINIIPQDIGRVILNLINNSFYAVTEKKKQLTDGLPRQVNYEPTVSVSTKKVNNKVEIRVVDNGNGIPQKVLDKIFQPFFTTKPAGQGTGLGLSLSYDIIKAHGGELTVETPPAGRAGKEGEGAEFIIQLTIG